MAQPLAFWEGTPTKQAIIDFVGNVTNPESDGFVAPAERVATFDNDGTLWCEQPAVQGMFAPHPSSSKDTGALAEASGQSGQEGPHHGGRAHEVAIEVATVNHRGEVLLSVVDHGPGISYEQHEVIFDRFTQLQPHATRSKGGAGLGLSIVKGLVEAMNGRVWYEPTPGGGATFTVAIPTGAAKDLQ